MPNISTLDICKVDLFTPSDELRKRYTEDRVLHVERLREMYEWVLANPDMQDKKFIAQFEQRYNLSRQRLYIDLGMIKVLLPMMSQATRDFHRFRANEMLLETYQRAKAVNDLKTMERAAADYAKINRVDIEDEQAVPYEDIVIQPFTATENPEILGLKRTDEKKLRMLYKSLGEKFPDITDVEYEEVDLELNRINPDNDEDESDE